MKESIKLISKNSFYQLLVVYSILVAISFFGFVSRFTIHFEIFALIVAFIGYSIIVDNKESINKKLHISLLILGMVLIFIFRAIPYFRNSIPLGYDAGIYKFALETSLDNIPNWMIVQVTMEPLFLYLMKPLTWIFSTNFLIIWVFIFFNILLGTSIYLFTKEYFSKRAGVIALLVFAVSTVQFITFTYMYYRNIIGLTIMLFTLTFLKRQSLKYRILFILFAGLLGAIHRPTFYIFGLSYFFYSILNPISKERYDFHKLLDNSINGLLIIAISLFFYLGKFWPAITSIIYPVANGFVNPGESPGTFISFFQYQFLTLPYIALSLLGFAYLIKNKKFNILSFWVIVNSIIVYFQFFFFNRFIIHLDIALIILAGVGFSNLIESKKKLGTILLVLMLASSAFLTYQESIKAKPSIDEQGLNLIKTLNQNLEEDAYVISLSSEFSPWLLAYSNRDTIAPGLFDENKWSEQEWNTFWHTQSKEETKGLIESYNTTRPIYLYTGKKSFNNDCFSIFLEENGEKIYRYIC